MSKCFGFLTHGVVVITDRLQFMIDLSNWNVSKVDFILL